MNDIERKRAEHAIRQSDIQKGDHVILVSRITKNRTHCRVDDVRAVWLQDRFYGVTYDLYATESGKYTQASRQMIEPTN